METTSSSVKILVIKDSKEDGTFDDIDIIVAINYAREIGVDAMNSSVGSFLKIYVR